MYKFYFVAPVPCTDGGGECAGNADGLISCPAGGGICIGKLQLIDLSLVKTVKFICLPILASSNLLFLPIQHQ